MRYISTWGEAPELNFVDVTLAGLARDGGLYESETWPVFSPDRIAALAGRPDAEVAGEVGRPFVGGTMADADLARTAREADGSFRHPAVAPLTQPDSRPSCWSCSTGRRRFQDLAMQPLAG